MVSAQSALFLLLVAVAAIVILTGRFKVNAFIALIGAAFAYGVAIGLPAAEVVKQVRNGFGGTLAGIGIVIVAGRMLGTVLDRTGAALAMTRAILRLCGARGARRGTGAPQGTGVPRAALAMNLAGLAVSIPVACDAAYITLDPLGKALAREAKIPVTVMAVALATGLYATHALVPPTPGPVAAAGALGAGLGRVLLLGLIAAVPASLAGLFWATRIAKRWTAGLDCRDPRTGIDENPGALPDTPMAFLPVALPIVLMLLKSVADLPARPFGGGGFQSMLSFLGDPASALFAGLLASLALVPKGGMREALDGWMSRGIRDSAMLLVITAAGGSFAQVIRVSPITDFIKGSMTGLDLGIFLPFIIAAALKTALGSSTVAIVTASGMLAPVIGTLGLDPALAAVAIGSGSMAVSHANDSYFWVVSQCAGMPVNTAYKAFSAATAVQGVTALAAVALMSLFI